NQRAGGSCAADGAVGFKCEGESGIGGADWRIVERVHSGTSGRCPATKKCPRTSLRRARPGGKGGRAGSKAAVAPIESGGLAPRFSVLQQPGRDPLNHLVDR